LSAFKRQRGCVRFNAIAKNKDHVVSQILDLQFQDTRGRVQRHFTFAPKERVLSEISLPRLISGGLEFPTN
jgi:hypothetical protein